MNLTRTVRCVLVCATLACLACTPARAQGTPESSSLSTEEIAQLVAPIAIYPDSLVSQVLMASTYPIEVVQAQRWAEQNSELSGDALASALNTQTWDPSVKSLVNFPDVLKMMSKKLDWTTKLGDAFLAQQDDVLAGVQALRAKAVDEGTLETTDEQVVSVEDDPDSETQIIVIESSDPDVIYVPTYDPVVVYGTWPYPAYPPYYYYPPAYRPGSTVIAFGAGFACGVAWGYAWGNCNWYGGDIDIDRDINIDRNVNIRDTREYRDGAGNRGKWQHNAEHRRGASYGDRRTAAQYGRGRDAQASQAREQYRGRAEQGRRDLNAGSADQFRGSTARAGNQRQNPGARPNPNQRQTRQTSNRSHNHSAFHRSGGSQYSRQASQRGRSSRHSMHRGGSYGRSYGGGARRGGGRRR